MEPITTTALVDEAKATNIVASNNRSTKGKVPKRIHKAEREKLKREHLNELFLDLANALELNQQNTGKAFILCEATRFLKDLFGQIESLRKDNESLLSESHYVSVERNELKEENSVLETQISELQTEIEARVNQSKPNLNVSPPTEYHNQQPELASHFPGLHSLQGSNLQQTSPAPAAVLVLPFQPDFQNYHMPDATGQTQTQVTVPMKRSSNVSKPHPRYPSAADSWQSQLLKERLKVSEEARPGGRGSDGFFQESETGGL